MNEQWRVIDGYPDYEVSDRGNVRRITARTSARAGHVLSTPLRGLYPAVDLCRDGERKSFHVHRLVAAAFLGPSEGDASEVNHVNGLKVDNRAVNLEYVTRQGNQLHAYREGLQEASGEKNGFAKLTWELVAQIREIAASPNRPSYAEMGRTFHVNEGTIRAVVNGRSWATDPFVACAECADRPGWITVKDDKGADRAKRCRCWIVWDERRKDAKSETTAAARTA